MLRLGNSKLVAGWIVLTIVASLVAALDDGWLSSWASLAPAEIYRGQIWRLVTWAFVEVSPASLVINCIAIFRFGGELADRWGDRRLCRFALEIVLSAAVVTCLLALVTGADYVDRIGGWAVTDALVIAWARQFPDRTLTLYGMELAGRPLVLVTLLSALAFAIFIGPVAMAPELIACVVATWYPTAWLAR